jgi:hypothetical protein
MAALLIYVMIGPKPTQEWPSERDIDDDPRGLNEI